MFIKNKNSIAWLIGFGAAMLLMSCQSQTVTKKQDTAPNWLDPAHSSQMLVVSNNVDAPAKSEDKSIPFTPLDGQSLKEFLLAEMAYRQQDYVSALALYYLLVQRVNDPNIAKKAAKIAAYLSQDDILSQMLEVWLSASPDNEEALMLGLSNSLIMNDFEMFESRFHKIMQQDANIDLFGLLRTMPINLNAFAQLELVLAKLQAQYDHPQMVTLQSFVLEHQGKFEQAIKLGHVGLKRFDNPMLRMMMIKAYNVLGMVENSELLLEQSYEIYASDRSIAQARIQLAWKYSQFDDAYKMTRLMYERHPGDPNLAYQYARLALKQQNYNHAKEAFESLLIYPSLEDEVNYSLGIIANEQLEFELALRYFSKVNPSNYYQNSQYYRANILWKATGDENDVVAVFDQLLDQSEIDNRMSVTLLEAEFWSEIQQYEIGLSRIEKVANEHDEHLGLQYQYSLMLDSAGQVEKSLSVLSELLEKKPDNADVLNAYGYVLGNRTDQVDLAMTYVKKALDIQPENPATLDSMGWLLYKKAEYAQAFEFLNKAYIGYKNDEIAAHLGAVLFQLGQIEAAHEVWEEGYLLKPRSIIINQTKKALGL